MGFGIGGAMLVMFTDGERDLHWGTVVEGD